jgi:hypothetical protein
MQFRYIELQDISKLHLNGIQEENAGNLPNSYSIVISDAYSPGNVGCGE